MRRLTFGLLVFCVLVPLPANAHSDEGEMTVTIAEQGVSGDSITLEVGIVYTDDGHLAEESSVTAVLTGPGGETLGPLDLPRIAGARYGAETPVSSPGKWSVVITSKNPTAEAQALVTVTEPVTTTTSAPAPITSTATTQPEVTTAPSQEAPESSFPVFPILAVGAIVGAGFAFFRRSRH